jgi:hypothetical protein
MDDTLLFTYGIFIGIALSIAGYLLIQIYLNERESRETRLKWQIKQELLEELKK